MINIKDFEKWIIEVVEPTVARDEDPGMYARCFSGSCGELYGLADIACILSTLNQLDSYCEDTERWRRAFRHFTDPDSGIIREKDPTHCQLHNTAFALGAMELLGILPDKTPDFVTRLLKELTPDEFLEKLNWREKVYSDSHQGAGLAAIIALTTDSQESGPWFTRYFDYCDSLFNPTNGMMGRDKPPCGDIDQIGGTFHYGFMYEHFRRDIPFPENRIDAILGLRNDNGIWNEHNRWWLTLDGIYLLSRSAAKCGHRLDEVKAAVLNCAEYCAELALNPVTREEIFVNCSLGVHRVTAAVSIFAEAQKFLGPDIIISQKPLKLVLDRRPFI